MDISKIIIIQKIWKGYFIRKYITIPSSEYQTKKWRMNRIWYKNGKHNECEIYQRNLIEKITINKCNKTNLRLNIITKELKEISHPYKNIDGFNYTENFDGFINVNKNKLYFNLKFICDSGGAQTRSLILTYYFIKIQIDYLLLNNNNNIYFINILDGDTSYKDINKFHYLLSEYKKINKYIFVGNLYNFQKWYLRNFSF